MKLATIAACLGATMAAPYTTLEGAGTTNPSKYLWAVAERFMTRIRGPVKIGYRAVGSSTGQKEFVGYDTNYLPLNDYGAGDIPMTEERYNDVTAAGRTMAHFPFVMGAIAVFYNGGTEIPNDVQLDACTLASVFSGQITSWNDQAIQDLNPGVALPDVPITVVHRTLGSSSTAGITQYIEKATKADGCTDNWGQGSGSTIDWFVGSTAAEGSGGVTDAIKATVGAIGYLDAGHGYGENLEEVALKNANGFYLEATNSEIFSAGSVAVREGVIPANATDSFAEVELYNLPGDTTWPITLISYIFVDVSTAGLGEKAATYTDNLPLLVALLEYINSDEGQEYAADDAFGFVGIPQELRDLNAQTIALIKESNPGAAAWMTFEESTDPLGGAAENVISVKRQSWSAIQRDDNADAIGDVAEDDPSLLEDIEELRAMIAELQTDVGTLQASSDTEGTVSGAYMPPQTDLACAVAILAVAGTMWAALGGEGARA